MNQKRADIQALRTIAVLSVAFYHLWPERLTGGYVGVDVFFVISGFLIMAHMLREVTRTGSISLRSFWARRVRRLLPASLLVLAVSAVVAFLVLPELFWKQNFDEIRASALYVLNWALASNSVDYLAAGNTPSLVQHYWSLSVEEQFYIVWPLLMVGAIWIASKIRTANRTATIAIVTAVVTAASLGYSISLTATSPATAYFVTPTRAWEFGAGALLALFAANPLAGREVTRTIVSWAGFAAIAAAVLSFDASTPFPGYTALLPVLGTLAVIWAGTPENSWSPRVFTQFGPVQWLGDVSYSLYLWHWPLIVAAPFMIAGDFGAKWKIVILLTAVLLAWVTKVAVEDPMRRPRPRIARESRWTFVAMAASMVVMLGIVGVGHQVVETKTAHSRALTKQLLHDPSLDCFGASAYAGPETCADVRLDQVLVPSLAALKSDTGGAYNCFAAKGLPYKACSYGSEQPDAKRVALIGDSHAAMLLPGLVDHVNEQNWALDTYLGATCVWGSPGVRSECEFRSPFQKELESAKPYDLIITTASRIANGARSSYVLDGAQDARVEDYSSAWQPLIAKGTRIAAVADNGFLSEKVIDCWVSAKSKAQIQQCTFSATGGFKVNDAIREAAESTEGVDLIDTKDLFCRDGRCPVEIGGVRVYWDQSHITATFSRTLAPHLIERINESVGWSAG